MDTWLVVLIIASIICSAVMGGLQWRKNGLIAGLITAILYAAYCTVVILVCRSGG